jgi:hypothetical protein
LDVLAPCILDWERAIRHDDGWIETPLKGIRRARRGNRYSSEEAKRMYHGTGGGILGFIALHERRLIAGTGSDRQAGMGTKERSIYISDVFSTANKYADYFLWIDDASQLSDVAACERKAK